MFTKELISKLRKDTPGCENRIHFNNAGAGMMPLPVLQGMKEYLDLEAAIGGYEAAELKKERIQEFYTTLASFLNCDKRNIAYTYNATDSYARALSSIPFEQEDIIMTSMNDYISNQIAFLSLKKRFGIRVIRVPDYPAGGIHLDQAESLIQTFKPKLVAITHVPTSSGLVQNVLDIGRICREENIWYLVDACQSVGQLEIDLTTIECDFLSATFRKFLRGPRGAGFLYVSDKALEEGLEPMFIDMRGAKWTEQDQYQPNISAQRFEQWEFPYALLVGATESVRYAMDIGMDHISKRTSKLAESLRDILSRFGKIEVLDRGNQLCGIVTFWVDGEDVNQLKADLETEKVNCSVSLREFNIMDFEDKNVDWAIRLSPHYYNTEEEIEKFSAILAKLI